MLFYAIVQLFLDYPDHSTLKFYAVFVLICLLQSMLVVTYDRTEPTRSWFSAVNGPLEVDCPQQWVWPVSVQLGWMIHVCWTSSYIFFVFSLVHPSQYQIFVKMLTRTHISLRKWSFVISFGNIDFAWGGNFDCVFFFYLLISVIQKKNTGLETQTLRLLEQETPPLHLKESPSRKTGHF